MAGLSVKPMAGVPRAAVDAVVDGGGRGYFNPVELIVYLLLIVNDYTDFIRVRLNKFQQ